MASGKLAAPFLALPRVTKRLLALTVDASLCVLTVWFAYYLRLDTWIALTGIHLLPVFVSLALALPIFISMGLYRAIFRYAGMSAFLTVMKAIGIYGIAFATIFTAVSVPGVPRTVGILQPLLLLIAIGLSRIGTRAWLGGAYLRVLGGEATSRVLIYGAGTAGRQLAGALSGSTQLRVMGFLDDDTRLQGSIMNGVSIYDPASLVNLVDSLDVTDVLLAIPSANRKRRNEIIDLVRAAKVTVRTLPDLNDLAQGLVQVGDLRELDIDDLLGRDAVAPNQTLLARNVRDKVVMVTGAGGSIGSELCRQIVRLQPTLLLLVDQSEFALYRMQAELQKLLGTDVSAQEKIIPLLASVRDEKRMTEIMSAFAPNTVYHAAAYKHVPMVEFNVAEGVRNNVLGTLTTARVASACGVSAFVLISTDKAVRPTNVMGATKRLAEMVLQAMASAGRQSGATINFAMVRFGNVLGSSGSVVPLFRQQIQEGGPVTLTHADITRYFMTIPEAAQLVIQAGAMSDGGDVFVLDMGEPVRIYDLARRMIELSGLTVRDEKNPEGDIDITIVGLRPGEKLYEELLIGDNPRETQHPRIMKASEEFLVLSALMERLLSLETALDGNDIAEARSILQSLVSGYVPEGDLVDHVFLRAKKAQIETNSVSY